MLIGPTFGKVLVVGGAGVSGASVIGFVVVKREEILEKITANNKTFLVKQEAATTDPNETPFTNSKKYSCQIQSKVDNFCSIYVLNDFGNKRMTTLQTVYSENKEIKSTSSFKKDFYYKLVLNVKKFDEIKTDKTTSIDLFFDGKKFTSLKILALINKNESSSSLFNVDAKNNKLILGKSQIDLSADKTTTTTNYKCKFGDDSTQNISCNVYELNTENDLTELKKIKFDSTKKISKIESIKKDVYYIIDFTLETTNAASLTDENFKKTIVFSETINPPAQNKSAKFDFVGKLEGSLNDESNKNELFVLFNLP